METIKNFVNKIVRKIKEFFTVEEAPVKKDSKTPSEKVQTEDEGTQLSIFDDVEIEVEEIVDEAKEENDIKIERHTAESITRSVLIDFLKAHGVEGSLSRLKKAELLEKFYELGVEFPEKK